MRAPRDRTLTPGLQLQLYLLTGLLLLPHVMRLPLPVSLFLFVTLGWRLISLGLPRLQPGRWLLIPVTLIATLLIYSQHQTLFGRDAGVSMLCVMLVLKTLEVRKRRDLTVTVFIAYFVIITHFLYDQSFLLLFYLSLILVAQTSLLLAINLASTPKQLYEPFLKTLRITFQALPIALILFVLFPRLTTPLWNFGYDTTGTTGLSERVSPGSISRLIQSSEVAFRVEFKQPPPPPEARYWRALVLWDTDGFSWFSRKDHAPADKRPRLIPKGEVVEYEVFLEPHHKQWLYALDLPAIAQADTDLTPDFLLQSAKPVYRPRRYPGISFPEYRMEGLTARQRQRALQLGEGVTARQRDIVRHWQRDNADAKTVVQRALDHFHQNPFVYTLNPPLYRQNPVEQFLFESREGFCEHYASAFTQLMRLAGVPARMVVGFQGGEYNRVGDYYTIRNYDAHAWSEVWLPASGWVRVDPTAAVAPNRVRQTIRPDLGRIGEPVSFLDIDGGLIGSALRDIGMLLDTAEVNWRKWVLGFSRDQQFGLMREFGLDFMFAGAWGAFTLALIFGVLALTGLRLVWQGRLKQSLEVRIYRRFCRRLANIGLPRAPYEGPWDYSLRISQQRPDLAQQAADISRLYIDLRYGPQQTRQQRQTLIDLVRRFRPRRISRAK